MKKLDEPVEYEDRIVFFIDFLGWKGILGDKKYTASIVSSLLKKLINDLGNQIHSKAGLPSTGCEVTDDAIKKYIEKMDCRITHFSDSVVISLPIPKSENKNWRDVCFIINKLRRIQFDFLKDKGILLRGGISEGKLVHGQINISSDWYEEVLYGEALNNAYLLESKSAKYPRIIIEQSLYYKIKNEYTLKAEKEHISNNTMSIHNVLFAKDTDLFFYIDYLSEEWIKSCSDDVVYNDYKKSIIENIQCVLDTSIKEKYDWLKGKTEHLHPKL